MEILFSKSKQNDKFDFGCKGYKSYRG